MATARRCHKHTSTYAVHLYSNTNQAFMASASFSIEGRNGRPALSKSMHAFTVDRAGCGFPQFFSLTQIKEGGREMAPRGSLTLTCALHHVAPITSSQDDAEDDSAPDNSLDTRMALEATKDPDVFLVAKDGERLPCHKLVLRARSAVFDAMFELRWARETRENEVGMGDEDKVVLKAFVAFMYRGGTEVGDLDWEPLLALLRLADKYDVPSLREEVGVALVRDDRLTAENVCYVARSAHLFNGPRELKDYAADYTALRMTLVKRTEGWRRLETEDPEVKALITERLNSRTFVQPYETRMEWSTVQFETG